jgi:hypothetical protein
MRCHSIWNFTVSQWLCWNSWVSVASHWGCSWLCCIYNMIGKLVLPYIRCFVLVAVVLYSSLLIIIYGAFCLHHTITIGYGPCPDESQIHLILPWSCFNSSCLMSMPCLHLVITQPSKASDGRHTKACLHGPAWAHKCSIVPLGNIVISYK